MLEASVYITIKKTISDPQGLAIKHALNSLHYPEVEEARVGKVIQLKLNTKSRKTTKERVEKMCRKLLANTVIEEYRFEIKKDIR